MNSRKTGIMISELNGVQLPLLFHRVGYDFIIIDAEHGGFDYKDILNIVVVARLSNIHVIIRLANNHRKDITKYMDMGADGLLLPMVDDIVDIHKVIQYAKYQPAGKRGISTTRAHSFYQPGEILSYMEKANKRTKIYAQIETIKGLDHCDEIAKLKYVDGLFIGPNDLSADYECLDNKNAKPILNAIIKVTESCHKYNKLSGIITTNSHYLEAAKKAKMDMFSVGSEVSLLAKICKETIKNTLK